MLAVFVASIRMLLPDKMRCHETEEFARCDDLGFLAEPGKVLHVPSHQVVGMGSIGAFQKTYYPPDRSLLELSTRELQDENVF